MTQSEWQAYKEGKADGLAEFLPDGPCDNGLDDFAAEDEWCDEHCGSVKAKDCWKHAIEERWIERAKNG